MRRLAIALGVLALALSCRDLGPHLAPGILLDRDQSDTCAAWSRVVVRVVDSTGRASANRVVEFKPRPILDFNDWVPAVSKAGPSSSPPSFQTMVADTTDAYGKAETWVRFGTKTSGVGSISVNVTDLGLTDSVVFSARPGNAVAVTGAPSDSAVFVSKSYTLRGNPLDQWGNPRPDPLTYNVISGPATINASTKTVTGTALGRAAIQVKYKALADTIALSIVPPGVIAFPTIFRGYQMQMDGSQRVQIGSDNQEFTTSYDWSPDAKDLAVIRSLGSEFWIRLITPGTPERTVLYSVTRPIYGSLRYSPDGQWIYFARDVDFSGARLFRIHPDGTGLDSLTNTVDAQSYPSPTFDGGAIAYVSSRTTCAAIKCVRVMDLATRTDRTINGTDKLVSGDLVSASPVEDLIAYRTNGQLWLVKSDGSGNRLLIRRSDIAWIDWSPDGKWLVVSAAGDVAAPELVNVSTTQRIPLGFLPFAGFVSWRQ